LKLPFAGRHNGFTDSIFGVDLIVSGLGTDGRYWSSSPDDNTPVTSFGPYAYSLGFNSSGVQSRGSNPRDDRLSIRCFKN
jgi:hypothetical protein